MWGLPGGPVVKNPPSSAEDMGLIPDQETKTSPHAATREACVSHKEPAHHSEDPVQEKKKLF